MKKATRTQGQTQPICPNCGQWQHPRFSASRKTLYFDCVNDCVERDFAPLTAYRQLAQPKRLEDAG